MTAGPVAGPGGSAPVWVGEQPVGDMAALARFVCRQACSRPRPSVTHDPYCVSMRRLVADRGAAVAARDEARADSAGARVLAQQWRRMAERALDLAMYGERPPGSTDTWRQYERDMRNLSDAYPSAALDGSGVTE